MNQGSNFLVRSFSNRDNFQQKRKAVPASWEKDFSSRNHPFIFISIAPELLNWSNKTRPVFPSIEINKPLFAPVYDVSWVRFKFRSEV